MRISFSTTILKKLTKTPVLIGKILPGLLILTIANFYTDNVAARQAEGPPNEIREKIHDTCGISIKPPSTISIVYVDVSIYPSERCVLAFAEKGRKRTPSEKSPAEGYYELADLVLMVADIPVTNSLAEYGFSAQTAPGQTVTYIGHAQPRNTRNIRYLGEKVDYFSVTNQGGGTLYAAEVSSFRSERGRAPIRLKRLDILWGNDQISIGSTVWCTPGNRRDCHFQEQVRKIFQTISVARFQGGGESSR